MDGEFVGTIEHAMETLHRLLMEELGSSSSFDSSWGSHHPSRECFMAQTPEGRVKSVSREGATPTSNPNGRSRGEAAAPSHLRMEQLRAHKLEIDEARQGLIREHTDINREIERHKDSGRTCATARTIHQRILTNNRTLPHFAWASQNITAMMALLHGLLEAMMFEDHQAR
jgi:hypothetical protein